MTPDEVQLLQQSGQVLRQELAALICAAALYGIYIIASSLALRSLWKRGLKTKGAFLQFWALFGVLLAYTADIVAKIGITSTLLTGTLIKNPNVELEDRLQLADLAVVPWYSFDTWLSGSDQGILFCIGDAIVVWRACVMFPQHAKTKLLLIALYLCGIGLSISSSTLQVIRHDSGQSIENPEAFLSIASGVYFILVNAMSTGLIGWLARKHRKLIKSGLGENRSKALTIMGLLFESGAIYCGIQIFVITLADSTVDLLSPLGWAYQIFAEISIFSSAIYPVIVILMVEHKRTIMDTPGMTEVISNSGQAIEFATSAPRQNGSGSLIALETNGSDSLAINERGAEETSEKNGNARWISKSLP